MRVLIVSAPLVGHLFPMVPLAHALRSAGHDVHVVTGSDAARAPSGGLQTHDIAPEFSFGRILRDTLIRHPLVARREIAGAAGLHGVGLLFGRANDQLADATLAKAAELRPDLIVHEPLAMVGALAATKLSVPSVLFENSLYAALDLRGAVLGNLGNAFRRNGLQSVDRPADILRIAPESLVGSRPGRPMRPVPWIGRTTPAPEWLTRPGQRPRILVSRSTVEAPVTDPLMGAVLEAASEVDAEFVVVRPDKRVQRHIDRHGLPANVTATDWIPIPEVLPHCAAIVHHGGAGTVLAALAAGIPQLLTPGPGDRTTNARVVAASGAGLAMPAKEFTPELLTRLVEESAISSAAREVAAEIDRMPEPAELVDVLEALGR